MIDARFESLLGKTLINIENIDDEKMIFTTDTNEQYALYHCQDCCETVTIEDVVGNLSDLLNSPILLAEEVTSGENPEGVKEEYQDSFTWTFYKLATIKGSVTIRWYGESNGYYSESVDFVMLVSEDEIKKLY